MILTLACFSSLKSYPKPSGPHIGNSCRYSLGEPSHNHRCTRVYCCPNSVDEENPTSADSQLVTRDDLVCFADLGEEEGALMEDEETVIHNLLRLREIPHNRGHDTVFNRLPCNKI